MSSDHTADQPTPAGSATPRDVIARWMYRKADIRYSWDSPFERVSERIQETYLSRADELLAALAAAGYAIAEAGAVTIPVSLAWQIVMSCAMAGGDANRAGRSSVTLDEIVERMMDLMRDAGFDVDGPTAIAAASEPAGGEGTP